MDLPPRQSLMVMDPSKWADHRDIIERRLAQTLGVDHFGSPKDVPGKNGGFPEGIPAANFPKIRYCPECKVLQTDLICKTCKTSNAHKDDPPRTMGPRLVAACPAGHIQDFPWKAWVDCSCTSGRERLLLTGGGTASESDLELTCKTCGRHRNLQGALKWLDQDCDGQRPWVGGREDCHFKLRGLMRGASNVYFPATSSALSIPPYSSHWQQLLEKHREAARENWDNDAIKEFINGNFGLKRLIKDGKISMEQLVKEFDTLYSPGSGKSIKVDEWMVLTSSTSHSDLDEDFRARPLDISGSTLADYFESVKVVMLLREVMALRGFTRIKKEGQSLDGPLAHQGSVNVELQKWLTASPGHGGSGRGCKGKTWIPAVELFGEGIFFQFKPKKLDLCLSEMGERMATILSSRRAPYISPDSDIDKEDPRLVVIHSFSHLLIREISLTCGYSAASLRERLYVSRGEGGVTPMFGVLIYTSASDSEGTLGGLIQQAKTKSTLTEHIERMVGEAQTCSQDPLCAEHDPATTQDPWGASCHACTQVAETSCESLQNRFLDRLAVVDPKLGYFR